VKKLFNTDGPIDNFDVVDVQLKLSDGSIYNNIGNIKFTNNRIDETTGTVKMRALFDNPHELLMPGDYVNVILTVKVPHEVMTVPQAATKTDVGTGYYVWVVKDGKAVKKPIDYDDQVVVKGIQNIYSSGQPLKVEPYNPENDKDNEKGEDK
ncbi:MAG: hypothetical protein MJ180_06610, partial [Candidatus Gastranaerophilales bacterium]|nr:hypothetical protein [Candidatus Gastranaerophilales bacterium]